MAKSPAAAPKSPWDRVREVPGFVVTTLVLLGMVLSGASFAIGYFAKAIDLKITDCKMTNDGAALAAQVVQLGARIERAMIRFEIDDLREQEKANPADLTLKDKIAELQKEVDEARRTESEYKKRSDDANNARKQC